MQWGMWRTGAASASLLFAAGWLWGQEPPRLLFGLPPSATASRPAAVESAAFQKDEEKLEKFLIRLEPPPPDQLFRLVAEEELRVRFQKEGEAADFKLVFPPMKDVPATTELPPRVWPYAHLFAEPNYVCYRRLWFEQRNSERYGWDLGVLQPGLSLGIFYADLVTLPVRWLLDPFRCYECSAGLCLPGDAVPLWLYPLWTR